MQFSVLILRLLCFRVWNTADLDYFGSRSQKTMKKLFILPVLMLFLLAGCKKKVDQIQQDLVIQAMTNGTWAITKFTMNGTTITSDFSGYSFKYYSNKTVDAVRNSSVEKTGTWDGNANTMTTSASFSNAAYPLNLINGNWHIDNNSWTFVEASQTVGNETKTMRLDKQ